jgi:hypothetical protein
MPGSKSSLSVCNHGRKKTKTKTKPLLCFRDLLMTRLSEWRNGKACEEVER